MSQISVQIAFSNANDTWIHVCTSLLHTLKTLLDIVEAQLKNNVEYLMSVLYNDVLMDQLTARNKSFEIYVVTIKIFMTEYHHLIHVDRYQRQLTNHAKVGVYVVLFSASEKMQLPTRVPNTFDKLHVCYNNINNNM